MDLVGIACSYLNKKNHQSLQASILNNSMNQLICNYFIKMHCYKNSVQMDYLKAGLSIVLKGRKFWILYSTTALVISLDFAGGSFAVQAMIHGVTEKELTLFTVGVVSVLTLAVLTSIVDESTTKIFYRLL